MCGRFWLKLSRFVILTGSSMAAAGSTDEMSAYQLFENGLMMSKDEDGWECTFCLACPMHNAQENHLEWSPAHDKKVEHWMTMPLKNQVTHAIWAGTEGVKRAPASALSDLKNALMENDRAVGLYENAVEKIPARVLDKLEALGLKTGRRQNKESNRGAWAHGKSKLQRGRTTGGSKQHGNGKGNSQHRSGNSLSRHVRSPLERTVTKARGSLLERMVIKARTEATTNRRNVWRSWRRRSQ